MPFYCIELFAVHEFIYGNVEVEADTLEEAREKALVLAAADEADAEDIAREKVWRDAFTADHNLPTPTNANEFVKTETL